MNDLAFAGLALGVCSVAALYLGAWIGRRGKSRLRTFSLWAAVAVLIIYFFGLWDRPILAYIMPSSGLIILANWLPCWGAFIVGIYANATSVAQGRRVVVCIATVLLASYSGVAPLIGTPPRCSPPVGDSALQFQTTPFTCSAAAAATVLRLHGIAATESELAELCLTREGTHWLGVYRGLKLKTMDTAWDVAVEPFTEDALNNGVGLPCVLSISVDTSRFSMDIDHGFLENAGHSVVYLCRDSPSLITVFDPSPEYGLEQWDSSILDCISRGIVLRLVPRRDSAEAVISSSRKRVRSCTSGTLTARL